jgi:hypothetical protein
MRRNWTASVGFLGDFKIYSADIGIGVNTSVRYNSYTGLMRSYGLGLDIKGMVNIGVSYSGNQFTLNGGITPTAIMQGKREGDDWKGKGEREKAAWEDKHCNMDGQKSQYRKAEKKTDQQKKRQKRQS